MRLESTKSQPPNPKEAPIFKLQPITSPIFEYWSLEFLWCLGFGAWCLCTGLARTQHFQERFAVAAKFLLKLPRAIALAAGPRFASVFMAAISPRVRVLCTKQVEVFFPVGPFLGQWWVTKTSLDPCCRARIVHTRLLHVVEVFVTRDRAAAEGAIIDCMQEWRFLVGF